jgi:hypothetical protein
MLREFEKVAKVRKRGRAKTKGRGGRAYCPWEDGPKID